MNKEAVLNNIQLAQQGDETAKELIVKNNLGLVWSIVHRFKNNYYDKEDLFQIGCIGLMKAINNFDVHYGVQFSTYAVPIIMGEIKRYFRDDGTIKVSRSLKELNIKLKHPVWILFGTDEESGFEDLEYYLTKKKPPIMGWTPDCKYPVVYAERGRAAIRVYADIKHQKEFNHFVNEYLLTSDDHANKLGLNIVDEEFGAMQLRGKSLIDCDEDLGFEFVLSYPASITIEEIMDKVKSKLSENLKAECAKNYDPVRFEKTGFLCSSLQEAYEKITGFDGTPVTTTGGTYAKLMPNIVPFGPSFPGQKGIGHNPDEWMDRKDLMTNAKIYALSLLYLGSGE